MAEKDNKKEIRNTSFPVSVVTDEDKRTVEGYALLFDTPSDGLSFTETIERGALDGVLAKSDVFATLNHDAGRGILARWKGKEGSLHLETDSKGLKYRFEAPKTALGDEILENIRRGEINESSFAFTVGKDTWEKRSDGSWKRTINKIDRLFDVSPVYSAAYSKTSVYMRGKEEAEAEYQKRMDEDKRKEDEDKRKKLESYYNKINNQLNI